jgi:hypothetical protein
MNLRVPQNAGNFLTSWGTVSFSSLRLVLRSNALRFCRHSVDCKFFQALREPQNKSHLMEASVEFQVECYWRWVEFCVASWLLLEMSFEVDVRGWPRDRCCSPSDGCRSSSGLNTSFAAERRSSTDWPSAGHSYDVAWGHRRLCGPTDKAVYLTFAAAVRTVYWL